jgi:hypothetical protein
VLSPLQTLSGEKPSHAPQLGVVILLLLALASRLGWLVLFLPVHDEGELQSHQLVCGVGLACLLTLVLPMAGVEWTLCDWTEGPIVPLGVRPRFCHTFLPAWLHASVRFPVKNLRQLL